MRLPIMDKEGLASDLDGTLVDNKPGWFGAMRSRFGAPGGFTDSELIKEYGLVQNVPLWKDNPKAMAFLDRMRYSNEMHFTMPQIEGSADYLSKISEEIIPVCLYATIRPAILKKGTEDWLKEGYPAAPVMLRPRKIPPEGGNKWKARKLESLFPAVRGIIDDNPEILKYFSSNYKGYIFLFGHEKVPEEFRGLNVLPSPDWSAVYERVGDVFGGR